MDVHMPGNGLELLTGKMRRILRVGIVQVDAPGRGRRAVLVYHMPPQVILLEYIIAQQTAGFPFARHIGHPCQLPGAVGVILSQMVLEEAPVGVDHQQTIVAYLFKILYLVAVHACLPGPLPHSHPFAVLCVNRHSIAEFRETRCPAYIL